MCGKFCAVRSMNKALEGEYIDILRGEEMVKINGEEKNAVGKTVAEYLAENGYDIKRVAVEINGDILPKVKYESIVLQDCDNVEIVSFVGGG